MSKHPEFVQSLVLKPWMRQIYLNYISFKKKKKQKKNKNIVFMWEEYRPWHLQEEEGC